MLPRISVFPQRSIRLIATVLVQHVPRLLHSTSSSTVHGGHKLYKREQELSHRNLIIYATIIPVLVLLSGLFAGLTLGYMSLDETQLQVLAISGTPKQREYARQIQPIRKNGHLLLVTLLLANMIVNESLPIIADPVLGGGFESVVVSTALIVIFSEIIPQSVFTRHGLYLGAKMAWLTRGLILIFGIISWPVAKFLEFILGPHHGIIYRRSELKELIAMHSSMNPLGGDLKSDTVTIIGATLDLQEKVVRQAMTPIKDVFMLDIESTLDTETLRNIVETGHSRVPVYEEVEMATAQPAPTGRKSFDGSAQSGTQKVKKIIGILLVKQCVLLDPKDAVPVRSMKLNRVPFVPQNMPLLGILDRFQEGRSHMAIVSRFSVDKAASIKQAVKQNMTQRIRNRMGMGDSDSSSDDEKDTGRIFRRKHKVKDIEEGPEDEVDGSTVTGDGSYNDKETAGTIAQATTNVRRGRVRTKGGDLSRRGSARSQDGSQQGLRRGGSFQFPMPSLAMTSMSNLEQSMPADAVLNKADAEGLLQSLDPAIMPLGIITLEDVLEELIGEEIYDEFDTEGARGDPYIVPVSDAPGGDDVNQPAQATTEEAQTSSSPPITSPVLKPLALKGLNFLRSRSAPPSPRESTTRLPEVGQQSDAEAPPTVVVSRPTTSTTTTPTTGLFAPPPVQPPPDMGDSTPTPILSRKAGLSAPAQASVSVPNSTSASRSTSPAPSLEVVLLERRRRQQGQATKTAGGPGKVSKFKSSPLSGGDVSADAKGSGNVDSGGNDVEGDSGKVHETVTDDKNHV